MAEQTIRHRVEETRWKLDQLKEAATVEGLRLVPLARSTGADERTDEPLVDVDEEIRAEALQCRLCRLWAVVTGRVGELQDRGRVGELQDRGRRR